MPTSNELTPEVEAVLRELCGCSANDAMTLQDVECHHNEVREAYRLGLAAGRDLLNRLADEAQSFVDIGWDTRDESAALCAAIRAAKEADRG
jgi:hypothetical protein